MKAVDAGGYLVIKKPWPSMLRTLWRDNDRYVSAYWEKFKQGYYVAGDSAHRDKDGFYWIMGRIDDVLNVAGHRLGTMEVESALVAHPRVAEAAVVGKPHEIKGESVFAFVVCRGQRPTGDTSALVKELRNWVAEQLGAIAKPDDIRFADNLPKTRSGKIMRRLLKAVARGEEITQDVSTLENPAILDQLRGAEEDGAAAPAAAEPVAAKKTARKTTEKVARKADGKTAKKVVKRAVKKAAKKASQPAVGKMVAARKGVGKAAVGKAAVGKAAKKAVKKVPAKTVVAKKAVGKTARKSPAKTPAAKTAVGNKSTARTATRKAPEVPARTGKPSARKSVKKSAKTAARTNIRLSTRGRRG